MHYHENLQNDGHFQKIANLGLEKWPIFYIGFQFFALTPKQVFGSMGIQVFFH